MSTKNAQYVKKEKKEKNTQRDPPIKNSSYFPSKRWIIYDKHYFKKKPNI